MCETHDYIATIRSKTTFKTEDVRIPVHPGQSPEEVANQVAASYGCELVSVKPDNVADLLRANLKQCLGFVEAWQCHLSDGGHTKAAATVEEVLSSARDAYRLSLISGAVS